MIRHPLEKAAGEAFGGEPDPAGPGIDLRLIIALFAIEIAAIGAFVWVVI